MAEITRTEQYRRAMLDLDSREIIEFGDDATKCYSLDEFLERWDGVVGVTITVSCSSSVPTKMVEAYV